jgi:GMP synthase (glutamine-hydrolysing)
MTNAAPKTTANIQRHDRILILDFGSQVTQFIARRLRENGVYCEVWPFNQAPEERVKGFAPKGIILSGGPASVTKSDSPRAPEYFVLSSACRCSAFATASRRWCSS